MSGKMVRSAAAWIVVLALVALMWPTWLGGRMSLNQVNGLSMEPTFTTGDLLVCWKRSSYDVGDVVVFDPHVPGADGVRVSHRIVGINADGTYRTQGDNRSSEDYFGPRSEDIDGYALATIPASTLPGMIPGSVWAVIFFAAIAGVCTTLMITTATAKKQSTSNRTPPSPAAPVSQEHSAVGLGQLFDRGPPGGSDSQ